MTNITEFPNRPKSGDVDVRAIETVSAQLDSLIGLCWLLAQKGEDLEARAYFAIGNAIEHEKNTLDRAIAGRFNDPPDDDAA